MKMIKGAALMLAAAMTLTLTACRKDGAVTSGDSSGSSTSNSETFLDRASKFIEADGRGYGKEQEAELGEALKNSFFSLKATEAYRYSSMGDYLPDDGMDFVVVDITVSNIFSESIPVGSYDYTIRWGDGDDNSDTAFEVGNLHTDYDLRFFPDDTTLTVGASRSGYLLFQVPSDSTDLQLEYLEVYEDEFEGNTYRINLGNPEFGADDIKPEPAGDSDYSGEVEIISGAIGETLSAQRFDFSVNSVSSGDVIGEYPADDGFTYLTADITVKNTSSEDIEIGADMIYIFYGYTEDGETDDYYDIALDATVLETDDLFTNHAILSAGGMEKGTVIFMIPEDSTAPKITIAQVTDDGGSYYYQVPTGEIASLSPISLNV